MNYPSDMRRNSNIDSLSLKDSMAYLKTSDKKVSSNFPFVRIELSNSSHQTGNMSLHS